MTDEREAAKSLANTIAYTLTSPNECDSNGEVANVVDGLFAIARGLHRIADCLEREAGGREDG